MGGTSRPNLPWKEVVYLRYVAFVASENKLKFAPKHMPGVLCTITKHESSSWTIIWECLVLMKYHSLYSLPERDDYISINFPRHYEMSKSL